MPKTFYEEQYNWLAEAKPKRKKQDPPNLSARRDDALVQFLVDMEDLLKDPENLIKANRNLQPDPFQAIRDYQGTRIQIAVELVPNAWIAIGTVAKPVLVFRDFQIGTDDLGGTYVMHYIGTAKRADGAVTLTYVMTHKNVAIKAILANPATPDAILWEVSGTPVFQKKIHVI